MESKEEPKQENCCTPIGQIKRYVDCVGCDRTPKEETLEEVALRLIPYKSTAGWMDSFSATERIGFVRGAKWMRNKIQGGEQ